MRSPNISNFFSNISNISQHLQLFLTFAASKKCSFKKVFFFADFDMFIDNLV